MKRAEFESALAQQGFTIQDVYDDLRDQLSLVRMQDAIVDSTIVTDDEIKAEYKRKHDRISIDWIAFTEAQMQSRVKITEADIEKTYNQGRQLYTQPEKFSYRALLLTKDKVDAGIAVSEQELRNAYNAALDNFRTPEKIHVRHILLSTDNKSDDEKKKLKAKAEDLVKQARGGADFAELAKKNSDDSGNASNGGDLGTFPRGQMVKPFEDAAFALKPKEVSGVVTTQFGYHIIQVIDKEQSTVTPFENVRPDLERELRSSRSFDALQNAAVKLRADVLKNPSAAADVAKTDNAELITMTDAAQSQEIPTVGVAPEVTAVLPSLKAGAVSDVIHLANDRVVVIVMDKRIPSRPSTLEEARADIVKTLNATAGRKLLDETAKEAADRLKKGEDLRAVAKALGGTVESASDVAMPDNVPGIGQAVSLQEAFKHKAGDIVGPSVIQNRTLVIKVLAKSDADMAGLAGERTQIVNSLRSARAGLNNRLWMDSVVKKMTDSGDITINEEEMKRVMERFRS
ncbi:MAG: peptidyl-prolyl cis-trans isomerase [Acidobacteriota bacterium]